MSKPLDLPMAVAKAFAKDMKLYFAETNGIKRDEIAGRQADALTPYLSPRSRRLRLPDIYELFNLMRDQDRSSGATTQLLRASLLSAT
jgi:hypothetical protein